MTRATVAVLALTVLCPLALTSCGSSADGGPAPGDTTPPTVVSMTVSDGETDVGLIEELAVVFSEDMDEATINEVSAYVAGRGPMEHISYDPDARRLSIVPDTLYAQSLWHELVLTDSITDLAGNPLSPDTTEFQTGPLDCAHLADRFEPNETTATATVAATDSIYYTLSVCGSDRDVFAFTLAEPLKVHINTVLKAAGPQYSWSLSFMRADGQDYATCGFSATQGGHYTYDYSFLPGTYYTEIRGGAEAPYALYDLELATSEPCEDDEYEDNDFIDEAAAVSPGLHDGLRGCEVDQDFYSFHAEAGQTITVTASQLPHALWPHSNITIYGPNQSTLAGDGSDEMIHTLSATALSSGTHYAGLRFWSEVGYTLDLDVHD